MNESNRRGVVVGIFVLVGIVLLIAAILAVGNVRKTFSRKIHVMAIFDDVGGLQSGNNVWFSGVKIGTVRSMRFLGKSHVKVVLNVDQASREFIRKDARVRLSSEGLIGNKIVLITGGTYRAGPIAEGDTLHVDKTLSTEDMMEVLQANNKNLLEITNNIKDITGKMSSGKGNLGKLLTDESLYNNLSATASSLRLASAEAGSAMGSIADFSSRLNVKGTLAYELGHDTILFGRLRSTAVKLQQLSDSATIAVNTLKEAAANRNTPAGVLLHDEEAGANLKATLKSLESGSKKLDEDLEALQHSFLLRRYFRKKNK